MDLDLTTTRGRTGARPTTTVLEIPHDQLDQFSPPEIRAALVKERSRSFAIRRVVPVPPL
jgi:hypothetical protein